jgi:hypothetical protein
LYDSKNSRKEILKWLLTKYRKNKNNSSRLLELLNHLSPNLKNCSSYACSSLLSNWGKFEIYPELKSRRIKELKENSCSSSVPLLYSYYFSKGLGKILTRPNKGGLGGIKKILSLRMRKELRISTNN